jgi:hypothetical protein
MNTRYQISIISRTSILALTALAAVATTALAPISASAAWGPGGMYGRTPGNNNGGGYGGAPNSAAMHPGPCVPAAHNCGAGGGSSPPGKPTGYPGKPSGGTFECFRAPCSPNGSQTGHPDGWNQGGYHPDGGRWDSGWRPYWRRPVIGPYTTAPVVTTYPTAPVVTTYATAPVQTYATAPVQTTPAQTYATGPLPTTYTPTYLAPAQPVANQSCNCLSKSYLPDGTVVFADNCSKETATAVPGGALQGQAGYQPR